MNYVKQIEKNSSTNVKKTLVISLMPIWSIYNYLEFHYIYQVIVKRQYRTSFFSNFLEPISFQ